MNEGYARDYASQIGITQTTVAKQSSAVMLKETSGRPPELPHALDKLSGRMSELHEAIALLDNRLTGTVARSCPPAEKTTSGQIKGAMQTSMGGQLDALNDATQGAYLRLRDLIDRLEF